MIRFKLDDTRFYETQRFGIGAPRYILWKHEWYIVHDEYVRSLKTLSQKEFAVEPYGREMWNTSLGSGEGQSILFACWGGLGDLISLTPIFRALKDKYGFETVGLSAPGINKYWFDGYVDHSIAYPPRQIRVEAFDQIFLLEEIFKETFVRNLTDVFAERMGMDLTREESTPFFRVDKDAAAYAKKLLPEKKGKYVGLHFKASTPERSIPLAKAMAVAHRIADLGHTALIFGGWNDLATWEETDYGKTAARTLRPGVYNLCGLFEDEDEIIGAMSHLDFFIGPDSGMMHVAGTLGIPGYAIFTPYESSIRIGYYPSLQGVDVDPKFHTYKRDTFFPEEEMREMHAAAIESIDWDALVEGAVS